MKMQSTKFLSFHRNRVRLLMAVSALMIAGFGIQAQTPYSNFVNKLFIPDTLSTWPLNSHSTIHLDVSEDSLILFPNASPSNLAVPGFPYHTADNKPIKTIAYSNPAVNNPGILGPTVIWWFGDSVTMEVQNHLTKETTTHWHGAHVAPWNDGGPHQVIPPGATWQPGFKVRDDVSTLWYHPHLHHHTMEQVQRGMAGLIIVKNPADAVAASLPHDYGVNDIPIIFQDKFVQYDETQDRDTINWCCSLGTIPLVNGTWKPTLEVPDNGLIRLRVLNGSSERSIALSLQRGSNPNDLIPFHVIASDAGYLNQPYQMNTAPVKTGSLDSVLMIMGGERYEIVFNATGLSGQDVFLMNRRDWMQGNKLIATFAGGPSYDNPSCYSGPYPMQPGPGQFMFNDPCENHDGGWMVPAANFDSLPMPLLRITPVNMPGAPVVTSLPSTLANWQAPNPASATTHRVKQLVGFNPDTIHHHAPPFSIDSLNFDLLVINDYIQLGATEIWDVYNSSGVAHPFHVHDIHFFITEITSLDANGNPTNIPVPPYMQGPKDVMATASTSDNFPGSGALFPQIKYRLIGTFDDFGVPNDTPNLYRFGYMYHCHILDHEDAGMMHQFVVVNTLSDVDEKPDAPGWTLFPNPSTGKLAIQADYDQASLLHVYNATGRLLRAWNLAPLQGPADLDLGELPPGMYVVRWLRPDGESAKRVVVMKP